MCVPSASVNACKQIGSRLACLFPFQMLRNQRRMLLRNGIYQFFFGPWQSRKYGEPVSAMFYSMDAIPSNLKTPLSFRFKFSYTNTHTHILCVGQKLSKHSEIELHFDNNNTDKSSVLPLTHSATMHGLENPRTCYCNLARCEMLQQIQTFRYRGLKVVVLRECVCVCVL